MFDSEEELDIGEDVVAVGGAEIDESSSNNSQQQSEDADNDDNDTDSNDIDNEDYGTNGELEVLPSDAEEGQEYHFDESGRLVRGEDAAREEAETEIARNLSARITQSPGDAQDSSDYENDNENEEDDQPQSRRRYWEKRQQSILDALNGVGSNNEEEGKEDGRDSANEGASDDGSADSGTSNNTDTINENANAGNSDDSSHGSDTRGRNDRLIDEYIDHLESVARRRERRANQDEPRLHVIRVHIIILLPQ